MNKRQKKKLNKKKQTSLAKSNNAAKKLSKAVVGASVISCPPYSNLPPPALKKIEKPKCGPTIPECTLKNFIEVKCSHDRKASVTEKFLEVVPAEGGDNTQLSAEIKGGCGEPPEWEISGFWNNHTKTIKTTVNVLPWHIEELRWISAIVPRTYRVRAGTPCQGILESVEIKAYPSDKLNLKVGEWKTLKKQTEWVTETFLSMYLAGGKWETLKGQLNIKAGWEENKPDHRAYYGYEIIIGFNPVLGGWFRVPLGPMATVPTVLKKYGDAYFFVEVKGGISVNGHWGRKSPDKLSATVDAKGVIQISLGASIFLMKPTVVRAEVSGTTGLEFKAETDPATEDDIRVKAKFFWQGIKGNITVKVAWGVVEFNREYKIVDESVIWKGDLDVLAALSEL